MSDQYAIDADRKYDLYSPEGKQHIYDTFAQMRREDPIHCQVGIDGKTNIWFITRHEDATAVLRDDKRFIRDWTRLFPPPAEQASDPGFALLNNHMLNKDGADHRRLRTLVGKAFTPSRIRQLAPRIQQIADDLLDEVAGQGEMDLIADFSYHLPTIVIAEMLGVPVDDRANFREWSSALLTPTFDEASQAAAAQKLQAFVMYLGQLFAQRRSDPQDDLISALQAVEEGGDQLSEPELFSTMVLLIVAGHETTVNLIANAMVALWQHPEQLAALQANPSLIDTAVEEFLRYDGAVERALARVTAEDVDFRGHHIPKGSPVIVVLGSANRDEALFEAAEQLDITRPNNAHMGFGMGVHYCLGAPLARLETSIAIRTLLERLPTIQPAIPLEDRRWRNMPGFRSLVALPVRWEVEK